MKRALRTLTIAALGSAALATALPAISSAAPSLRAAQHAPRVASFDPVLAWNRFLLDLQAAPGAQPATVHPTYELAILHASIYDAVVSIDHSAAPYLTSVRGAPRASTAAAADAAAHDTLVKLYPNERRSVDARYAAMLARLPAGRRTSRGVRVGFGLRQRLRLHRHLAGIARRPAVVRELLRGGRGSQREPHLQRQPHPPGRGRR